MLRRDRLRFFLLPALASLLTATWAQVPQLVISPQGGEQTLALGSSTVFTCKAEVESPENVAQLKWWGPDRNQIPEDSSYRVYVDQMGYGKSLGLFINKVEERDAGMYNCTATYANSVKLNAYIHVTTYQPITYYDTPTEQFAKFETDDTVQCHVMASPPPIVDWLRNKEVIMPGGRYTVSAEGLTIKHVAMDDEGVYTCRARVTETGQLDYRDISLEVIVSPSIEGDLPDEKAIEGNSVVMKCKAKGRPEPTYKWVNNRGSDVSTLPRFTVDKYDGTMSIADVHKDDGGYYKCMAVNRAGSAEKRSYLTVILKPKIEELLNISVEVGQDARLTCKATGEPLPDVSFWKLSNPAPFTPGIQLADERIQVTSDKDNQQKVTIGSLEITELLRSDDGLYACIASNTGAETRVNGHLTVEFPPSFANTPMKEAWSWENNPVNLTCVAESIPNATIAWEFEGRPIEQVDRSGRNLRQLSYGPSSTLKVTPAESYYYGIYTCKATNKLGEIKYDLSLKEARPPSSVLQVRFDKVTATTITFDFFGPKDDGGLPVTAYGVEYKENGEVWENAKRKVWPVDVPYILEGLEPTWTYTFRFAAENSVGFGRWDMEQSRTMPKRSAPAEPTILGNVVSGSVNSPYPDRYDLRWTIPADNGEPIDMFLIHYCPVKNSSNTWQRVGECTNIEVRKPGTVAYELNNLRPETHYKVELRAHNLIGNSVPGEIVVKTARDPTQSGSSSDGQASTNSSSATAEGIRVLFLLVCLTLATSFSSRH